MPTTEVSMSTIDEEMPGLFEGFAAERRFEDVLWFSRKAFRFLLAFRRLELQRLGREHLVRRDRHDDRTLNRHAASQGLSERLVRAAVLVQSFIRGK